MCSSIGLGNTTKHTRPAFNLAEEEEREWQSCRLYLNPLKCKRINYTPTPSLLRGAMRRFTSSLLRGIPGSNTLFPPHLSMRQCCQILISLLSPFLFSFLLRRTIACYPGWLSFACLLTGDPTAFRCFCFRVVQTFSDNCLAA